jgi:plasmid maintenance system antidote protein VapI
MSRQPGIPITSPHYTTPSELLAIHLARKGMTQIELSRQSGVHKKIINGIFRGRYRITPSTAIKLEKVLDVPARAWNVAQSHFDFDPHNPKAYAMKLVRKTHPMEIIYHYDSNQVLQRVQLQLFYRTIFQARKMGKEKFIIATLPTYYDNNGVIAKGMHEVHRHMQHYIKWLGSVLTVHTLEVIRNYEDGEIPLNATTDPDN